MAAVVSIPFPQVEYQALGSLRGTLIRVTLATNDYVTNGIDVSGSLPSGDVVGAIVLNSTGTGSLTQVPSFNATNKKLVLTIGAAGVNTEAANGSSDAQVVTILVLTA